MSWWYTFRLLNFIFHQLLITYNSMTLNLILKFLSFLQHLTYDFQVDSAMRFFKNASKTPLKGRKKAMYDLERARPKKCASILSWKKCSRGVQKR